jgi:hypothetical protein
VDYASLRRPSGGLSYAALALVHFLSARVGVCLTNTRQRQLLSRFAYLPAATVPFALRVYGELYAPAYLVLRAERNSPA